MVQLPQCLVCNAKFVGAPEIFFLDRVGVLLKTLLILIGFMCFVIYIQQSLTATTTDNIKFVVFLDEKNTALTL